MLPARCSDTFATLHLWTQVVGKIRLACAPPTNHWWQVPLYLTTRGLTTSPMPYKHSSFQIDFDFLAHELHLSTSDGQRRVLPLRACPVADFYRTTLAALHELGIAVRIWPVPVEIADAIPFHSDYTHTSYDPACARQLWRALLHIDRVLNQFRARFVGKVSPVHFFWGAFDLAVTRFSGRSAPRHPGVPHVAPSVMHEAYSHEVSSCGFWPGNREAEALFYAYAYPEPQGFKSYTVQPDAAYYDGQLGEFVLPYEAVRTAASPDATLLAFLQTTYEAAATLANWDRAALERETTP
jgi:hypothetical protein